METEILDEGRLVVARRHLPLLRHNALDTFARIMAAPEGEIRRNFPGRRTSRIELRTPGGTTKAVYLKRYHPDYLSASGHLLRRLHWPGYADEARAEWTAVHQVRALGIPTLDAIAYGQDQTAPGRVRSSFVMTAELVGADEGDTVAKTMSWADRRRLLRRVAAHTRALHAGGYVHRDLYLCHYMVEAVPAKREPGIFLIDLQRLCRPRWRPERWKVKDLAALVYSSLKAGASPTDIAAAYRVYRNEAPLNGDERRLARRVLQRVAWLKTRTPRHDPNFQQLA